MKTLVQTLVEINSPSGQEAEVAQRLIEEMGSRGFDTHLDEVGNAIGVIGQGDHDVYLVGHMDTVPGEIPVCIEENKLYGRGSVDAKGCLATFVEAASQFKDSDKLKLTVVGCIDEEDDSQGAKHLLKTHNGAKAVIIGEPSGWSAVTLGYKGSFSLLFELVKPRTHRGADETTPTEDAVHFYNQLCAAYPERGAGFEQVGINLIAINTEFQGNHEAADLLLNIRTPLDFDLDDFLGKAQEFAGPAGVQRTSFVPAVLGDKRNELVRSFLSAIRTEDVRPIFKKKTGTSDMNLLNAWECPILAYGPGDSSLDHTPNEHLDLDEYKKAIRVLTHALRQMEMNLK